MTVGVNGEPELRKADRLPLSVAIVCRDSERTIGRVVESVRGLASEIIALDSGSTDGTIKILRAAGARVVHQPWLGFVAQKQAALDLCAQPWALHLDSDESLEPALTRSLRAIIERDDPRVVGGEVNRKVWYAGGFLEHAWQPEWRLRLGRRGRVRWGGYDPHDAMEVIPSPSGGEVRRLAGDLRHDCVPTIGEFLERQARHARTAAESLSATGRRGSLARLALSPLGEFAKQMVIRGAFLDGWRGWVAASASSAAAPMKHAALLEASRRRDRERRP